MNDDELLEQAEAAGYTLTEDRWQGRPAWRWRRESGPAPFFADRGEALRWFADELRRRQLT